MEKSGKSRGDLQGVSLSGVGGGKRSGGGEKKKKKKETIAPLDWTFSERAGFTVERANAPSLRRRMFRGEEVHS